MNKKETYTHSQQSKKDMKLLELLHHKKNFKELEIETKKLIEIYPNFSQLFNILGYSLHKQGHLKSAIINYEQAISINPKFIFAYNNLGNVYKDLGKFNLLIKNGLHSYQELTDTFNWVKKPLLS